MHTLLLGTLYLPSAALSLDLILEYSITLNSTEQKAVMRFGPILTVNVVQRYISIRITSMNLANLTRDKGLISFTTLR